MKWLAALAVVALILIAVLVSIDAAGTLVFGWIQFLARVIPALTADGPSIMVGLAAVVLFSLGIHYLGRMSYRTSGSEQSTARRWTIRSTAATVIGVIVLFAAGISMIGIVHQTGWLLSDDQPLHQEGLSNRGTSSSSLREIAMGTDNYESTYDRLPPAGTFSPEGEMRHSWETHILPYMGYATNEIDMNRAWNDPVNAKYFQSIVPGFINRDYRTPPLRDANGFGLSHYAANRHVLTPNKSIRSADIVDGAQNTLLIGEVNAKFQPWGHPVNSRDPAIGIGRSASGFGGPPGNGGVSFVMADGSVRFISDRIDPKLLRALSTPAGRDNTDPE